MLKSQHARVTNSFKITTSGFRTLSFLVCIGICTSVSADSGLLQFSPSAYISDKTGLATFDSVVFDLVYDQTDPGRDWAPTHSWKNFEGPSLDLLASAKISGIGLGYRKQMRIFGVAPIGYGASIGVCAVADSASLLWSSDSTRWVPYLETDGTVLGINIGMNLVFDRRLKDSTGLTFGLRY